MIQGRELDKDFEIGCQKIKQSKKQRLSQSLFSCSSKLDNQNKISFFCGYISSAIQVQPSTQNIWYIQSSLTNLIVALERQLISYMNLIEIITESLDSIDPWNYSQDEDQSKLTDFHHSLKQNYNQISQCRRYLRQKWYKQANYSAMSQNKIVQQPNLIQDQTLQVIKKIEEEQRQYQKDREQKQLQQQNKIRQMLQKQQEQRIKQLDKKQKLDLTCEICAQNIEQRDIGSLSCGHIFHKQCIRDHIEALVNVKKVQIPCPKACGSMLPVQDVEEFIDGDLLQKYNKFCFDIYVQKHDKQISWCPTPGCTAVFSFDNDFYNYNCLVCHKNYCLKCRCIFHKGMTCAEYKVNNHYGEEDRKFEEFVRGAKFKQCPKCNYWVQRSDGCSTMTCRCGHQFCYDCGGSDCPHGMCKNQNNFVPPRPYRDNRRGLFRNPFRRNRKNEQ